MKQMHSTCKELEAVLDSLLCGGSGDHSTSSEHCTPPVKQAATPLPKPLTVMGLHNTPVIVEDPVRFRKDIQAMVLAQTMSGLPTEKQLADIKDKGSMIEIATVAQMVKAAAGDLDSFKYMMDRVLGKPVNQTNTVSMTVSYEQMLDNLDPEEVITPKHVFCDEV